MADIEHAISLSTKSVFDIASTSKQFVAMSAVLLARQGKLSMDDEIQKYLPQIKQYGNPITIRHLIHHTSGLRDYLTLMSLAGLRFENEYPDDEVISLIAQQQELDFPPGEEHLYSNTGYLLLAEIVKLASGMTMRTFAAENIFVPLGMKNTHFHDDFTEIVPNRAVGYSPKEHGGFRIDMTIFDVVGDGGVYTTVEDLAFWDGNFYNTTLGGFGQDLIEEVTTSPAWRISETGFQSVRFKGRKSRRVAVRRRQPCSPYRAPIIPHGDRPGVSGTGHRGRCSPATC